MEASEVRSNVNRRKNSIGAKTRRWTDGRRGGRVLLRREGPPSEGPELSHREASEYIASMLESLRQVASSAGMPFLAYLINVALEEANLEKAKRD